MAIGIDGGISILGLLAGVAVGLLLLSEIPKSVGIDGTTLRLFESFWEAEFGDPDRELLALPGTFFFFTSASESLLSELSSLDDSVI